MKRILTAFKNVRLRGKKSEDTKRLPSLVKAMRSLVSGSVMREVVASSHDRRQWGVLAAAWVGVSEREFIGAAAREMGLEFEEHVVAPDLTGFGTEARAILAALRKAGVSVVIEQSAAARFVAVDPAEVRALALYDGSQEISIAPWSEIAKALDAAERVIAEGEANADFMSSKKQDEISAKVIEILVREAALHGAQAVELITNDEKTRYQFTTPQGKTGVGSINREALQHLLRHLHLQEGTTKAISQREVFIRSLGNAANFRLSWGANSDERQVTLPAPRQEDVLPAPVARSAAQVVPIKVAEAPALSVVVEKSVAIPILVIDDNPMFCRVIERLLKRDGFDPCFAENGSVALEKLASSTAFRPKAIICDLHMPLMNGKDFLQRVKSDERFSSIPVVMLTSDEDVEAELSLLSSGAAAFLSKSKDPRVLSAQIQKLTRGGVLQEAA